MAEAHQQVQVLEPGGEGGEQVEEKGHLVKMGRIHHRNFLPLHPQLHTGQQVEGGRGPGGGGTGWWTWEGAACAHSSGAPLGRALHRSSALHGLLHYTILF